MRTINGNRIKILVLLTSALLLMFMNVEGSFASDMVKIYWANYETSEIQQADSDGTEIVTLVSGLTAPFGIALDENDGKLYWADNETGTIHRANLDGSPPIEELVTGLDGLIGIALDTENRKIYWTRQSPAIIQWADLDGQNVENFSTPAGFPFGIAVDATNGKIYWTTLGPGAIQSANLDGTEVNTLISELDTPLVDTPLGIALDTENGKMYWTDGEIQSANLDGTNLGTLVSDVYSPLFITLDKVNGKIYWTDDLFGKIQRANIDGTAVEDLIEVYAPTGIALTIGSVECNDTDGDGVCDDEDNFTLNAYGAGVAIENSVNPDADDNNLPDDKETALDDLYALGVEDCGKKNNHEIEKALKHLSKSLNIDLWFDATHPEAKHGHKVFDEEKKAVKSLMKVVKKGGTCAANAKAAIDLMIDVDEMLAQTAFDEAEAQCDNNKCQKEIDKALKEMDKAQKELDHMKKGTPDPKYDKAIDHYKHAWKHALKAMKKAAEKK